MISGALPDGVNVGTSTMAWANGCAVAVFATVLVAATANVVGVAVGSGVLVAGSGVAVAGRGVAVAVGVSVGVSTTGATWATADSLRLADDETVSDVKP